MTRYRIKLRCTDDPRSDELKQRYQRALERAAMRGQAVYRVVGSSPSFTWSSSDESPTVLFAFKAAEQSNVVQMRNKQ